MPSIEFDLQINVENATPPAPPPSTYPPGVLRTLGYGDEPMVRLFGLTTELTRDNFDHVNLYSPVGGWGAVHKFQRLDLGAMQYLEYIQPNDYDQYGYLIHQKMNWLIGYRNGSPPARPYWTRGDEWDGNWTSFEFGTIVFGHQLVQVEVDGAGRPREYAFYTSFPNDSRMREVIFFKTVGMKRSQMGLVTHQSHPWLIQKATAANSRPIPDSIDYAPRGVMYHPIWDLDEWPSNYGNDLYLAKECVVSV